MQNEHLLLGLHRKRAEIAGQIEAQQMTLRQMVIDLDALDATIRLFDPNADLAEIKPKPMPPRHAAVKGDVVRAVLATLRAATRPMTQRELALVVMAERGLNVDDLRMVVLFGKRVGACLRHHRTKGLVQSHRGAGTKGELVWEVVR